MNNEITYKVKRKYFIQTTEQYDKLLNNKTLDYLTLRIRSYCSINKRHNLYIMCNTLKLRFWTPSPILLSQ